VTAAEWRQQFPSPGAAAEIQTERFDTVERRGQRRARVLQEISKSGPNTVQEFQLYYFAFPQ